MRRIGMIAALVNALVNATAATVVTTRDVIVAVDPPNENT